jgi:integral membrane sensor domain MASE1
MDALVTMFGAWADLAYMLRFVLLGVGVGCAVGATVAWLRG